MSLDLLTPLREHFAYPAFRPGQEEALRTVLAGRDALVVMPTGSGKSLIYQLAALMLPGTAIVFSPLMALMKDQVDAMQRRGIPATYINASLEPAEADRRLQGVRKNNYKLVLIAPERLRSGRFRDLLKGLDLSLLVLDEAHCLSQWGHDFRPDYLHIARLRGALPGIRNTLALTATATPRTQDSIVELLAMPGAERLISGFNRPNLFFDVRQAPGKRDKLSHLHELLRETDLKRGAAIIYTGTRTDAEEVAEYLREVLKLPAQPYHGAMPARTRDNVQDQFLSGDLNIVVATNAFGMGIDRPNVRLVAHYSIPASLEAYYQEAGRAGRDGLPARAVLLYSAQDISLQEWLIENNTPDLAELRSVWKAQQSADDGNTEGLAARLGLSDVKVRVALEMINTGDAGGARITAEAQLSALARRIDRRRAHRHALLAIMRQYVEADTCRRRLMLDYFGDRGPADAPVCCDVCESRALLEKQGPARQAASQSERAALIVLDTISGFMQNNFSVGKGKLAQILKGSSSEGAARFFRNRNYGKFATLKMTQIDALINQLMAAGHLKQVGGERPVLALTPRGEHALKTKAAIDVELHTASRGAIERKQRERSMGNTVHVTLNMLSDGRSVQQVAAERQLTVGTIYSHCAELITERLLDINAVVPADRRDRIVRAIESIGSDDRLAPIKTVLPPDYDFGEIRCVANWRRLA